MQMAPISHNETAAIITALIRSPAMSAENVHTCSWKWRPASMVRTACSRRGYPPRSRTIWVSRKVTVNPMTSGRKVATLVHFQLPVSL